MDPFIGEIRLFSFPFAPQGWALCQGQLVPIRQSPALFSLLGARFGGNGQTTYALPDLRGRAVVGMGETPGLLPYGLGEQAGTETVELTIGQMPRHQHSLSGTVPVSVAVGTSNSPQAACFATAAADAEQYGEAASNAPMAQLLSGSTSLAGDSLGHENRMPFLVLNYCIAVEGIYPRDSKTDQYLGEIRAFGFDFAPEGWTPCDGRSVKIADNRALYDLIGITYGGDGTTTFNLPNLQSRVAAGIQQAGAPAPSYTLGTTGGTEAVALSGNHLARHQHGFSAAVAAASGGAASNNPAEAYPGPAKAALYASYPTEPATLAPTAVLGTTQPIGGSEEHSNLQPVLALNYLICTQSYHP